MSLLMIKCPHTARSISTGIEVGECELALLPDIAMQAICPACGLTHTWWKREAWLADYVGRPMTLPPAILGTPHCI